MTKISDSSKVFLLVGALTVFADRLRDIGYKRAAKLWLARFINSGRSLWLEIQKVTKEEGELCNVTFDDLEAYTVDVLTTALDVDVEDMEEFSKYIKQFKSKQNEYLE
jgi:hypothetical protein